MKKYILIGSAEGIGGWELYIDSRCQYCKQISDQVFLLHTYISENQIKLENIKKTKRIKLKELRYPPQCYSKRQRLIILERILKEIDFQINDEVFIESTALEYSLWGELLANKTNGTNYLYLLSSYIKDVPNDQINFFKFKYDNLCLSGQTDITLPDLFKNHFIINDTRSLSAVWNNPICEYRKDCQNFINDLLDKKNLGYKIIGYFGNLNKPHFNLLCQFLTDYFNKHMDCKFYFVSIGSSTLHKSENEQNKMKRQNCCVLNIPSLYPVPKQIFQNLDICIASWGSSIVSARVCKRTIRLINDIDIAPQGIIGITIRNFPCFKQESENNTLTYYLDRILFGDNYANFSYVIPPECRNVEKGHMKIDEQLRPFKNKCKTYYDIENIKCKNKMETRIKILNQILGVNLTLNLRNLVLKIKRG